MGELGVLLLFVSGMATTILLELLALESLLAPLRGLLETIFNLGGAG